MNENSDITADSKVVFISGHDVPSATELMARLSAIIPPGMEIATADTLVLRTAARHNGPVRLDEVIDFRRADIVAWNKAVDRKKAEKKALKGEGK